MRSSSVREARRRLSTQLSRTAGARALSTTFSILREGEAQKGSESGSSARGGRRGAGGQGASAVAAGVLGKEGNPV